MPGTYTEPESRAAPTNDPKCASLLEENDEEETDALSYAYHLQCPNDQSLINISGRAFGGNPPQPPNEDRHGIPATGPCVKCNLQLEGSGPTPNDVVVDAGRVESGNAGPVGAVKDVVIRLDRADGAVIRNLTARHADEHGIYVLETDGYRLERFKAFYNADYGVLAFASDHGLMQKCDAAGSGDSGLYPGGSPETGEQTREGKRRYNTEIRYCDMRHNAAGYSGTDGNAVWLHHNNLYDNANGFTTDVFTASGHPGFPQDSDLLEKNEFYSNNFNPYTGNSDVRPTVPMPVGTGMWIAGGNNNVIRNNWFYDNWRRGTMLFAVPNVFICPTPTPSIPGCNGDEQSTSHRNQFYGNKMGVTPKGKRRPNGTDFWWDEWPGNANNCWFKNTGTNGNAASVKSVPADPALGLRHEHGDGFHRGPVGRVAPLCRRAPGRPVLPVVRHAAEAKRLARGARRIRRSRGRGLRGRLGAGRAGRGREHAAAPGQLRRLELLGPRRAAGHDRTARGPQRRPERGGPRQGPRRRPGLRPARGPVRARVRGRLQALQALRARGRLPRPVAASGRAQGRPPGRLNAYSTVPGRETALRWAMGARLSFDNCARACYRIMGTRGSVGCRPRDKELNGSR